MSSVRVGGARTLLWILNIMVGWRYVTKGKEYLLRSSECGTSSFPLSDSMIEARRSMRARRLGMANSTVCVRGKAGDGKVGDFDSGVIVSNLCTGAGDMSDTSK